MHDLILITGTLAAFGVINVIAWRWQCHAIEQSRYKPQYRKPFRLW